MIISRYVPTLALAIVLAAGAQAQETAPPPPPPPPAGENGDVADARADYGAALEAAQQFAAQRTGTALAQAGEEYLRAADIAENSGDEELEPLATGAREAAISSFADAGSTYASQQEFAGAGQQFLRAAEIAGMLGDEQLQGRLTGNAGTAFVQAQDFDQAVATFDQALELAPDNIDFAYSRAVALRQAGDTEAALAAFAEVRDAALEAGDEHNAQRSAEAAGRIHLLAGRDEVQAQNWRAAIAALDQAAEFLSADDANLNTLYANAYYRLGVQQVQAEQWGPARTSLQRAQEHARVAGRDQIIQGAQQQLDFIQQVTG